MQKFTDLPPEIHEEVGRHLEAYSLANLRAASRSLADVGKLEGPSPFQKILYRALINILENAPVNAVTSFFAHPGSHPRVWLLIYQYHIPRINPLQYLDEPSEKMIPGPHDEFTTKDFQETFVNAAFAFKREIRMYDSPQGYLFYVAYPHVFAAMDAGRRDPVFVPQ